MKACMIACLALASVAGAAGIGGPVSGYVLDRAGRSLRPINGLPGSATLGSPVVIPFAVEMAAASVRQDYALVTGTRGGQVYLAAGLQSGQPAVAPLDGAIPVSGMMLGGSGTAAVLYSERSHLLQFVSGLPGHPQTGAPVDIGSAGPIAAVAPDGTGTTALLVAADGGLYSIPAGAQAPQLLARIPGASSAALMPNGRDALVGNSVSGDVLLVSNFAAAGPISTLAGARDGIASAVAVAAIDGSHAAAIDATGRMAVIDLGTSAVAWVALAGAAERLDPLDNGLLLLNQAGPQALLLFDAAHGGAFFVPPAGNSSSTQGTATWTRH